jgi:DNA-binding response OmpR family regulator
MSETSGPGFRSSEAEKEQNRGRVVLAVDDAPELLLYLRTILRAEGYAFFGAASGYECLEVVSRLSPRLILLDVEMGGLDGFATCQRLRIIRELNNVPIAFLTAHKTGADVVEGLAAGGNDFIAKPFDRTQLLERVRHWTQRTHDLSKPDPKKK